jgi:uncharacterized membrane protein YbhN (UPF0104 family)
MQQVRGTIWAWARLLMGAGILGVVVWRVGTGAFVDGLRVIDAWTLLAAFLIGVLSTVASAWRWSLVARGMGIRLPLGTAVADYYRALFFNAALPSGVLGDVHRAVRHGQEVGNVGRGVRAVVLERFAGQVVLVVSGLVVLFAHPHLLPPQTVPWVAAALIAVAGLLFWLSRGTSRVGRGLHTMLVDARRGLLGRRVWLGVAVSSVIVLAGHLATFVLAARAAGSSASVWRLAPLMLMALFAMAIPLNIGGWGPREAITAWAFGAAGLGASQGLTTAVVYGLFALVASLPGVAVLAGRMFTKKAPATPVAVAPGPAPRRTVELQPV